MPIPHWTGVQQCVKSHGHAQTNPRVPFYLSLHSTLGTKSYICQDLVQKEKNPPRIINIGNFLKDARDLKDKKGTPRYKDIWVARRSSTLKKGRTRGRGWDYHNLETLIMDLTDLNLDCRKYGTAQVLLVSRNSEKGRYGADSCTSYKVMLNWWLFLGTWKKFLQNYDSVPEERCYI